MKETPSGKVYQARTRLAAAGRNPAEQFGFVNTPIYRGSTVLFPTYADLMARTGRFSYGTQGRRQRRLSKQHGVNWRARRQPC